jgi:hypothetical protein
MTVSQTVQRNILGMAAEVRSNVARYRAPVQAEGHRLDRRITGLDEITVVFDTNAVANAGMRQLRKTKQKP